MSLIAVARHCRIPGFDGVRDNVEQAYEVLDLYEALNRKYQVDAHLVAYVVQGATRQPRINKPGLPHFSRPVEMEVLFCDVDNPNHAPWTDQMFAEAMHQYDTIDVLQTVGIYHTAHGCRIVQPLDVPIPVQEVEPYIHHWLLKLEQAGLQVDWACKDWTRHYRLPHVIRGGAWYRSPWVCLKKMQPISVEHLPTHSSWAVSDVTPDSKIPKPIPSPITNIDWSADVPRAWYERVETIADAVREVETEWHTLFLAIAGALLSRKVPKEHVPALCRAISIATGGDTRTEDREIGARTTVQRWLAKQPTTGYLQLAAKWPDVAMAIDDVTAIGTEARMRALAAVDECEQLPSLEQTSVDLLETIRSAPAGVTLISAECGLGKTEAAIQVTAERASKEYASPNAKGQRAPLGSKTSISVDKNELAKQVQKKLEGRDIDVKRIFGPLSVLRRLVQINLPTCEEYDLKFV